MTVGEIAASKGWSVDHVRLALRKAKMQGRLLVGWAPRECLDGLLRPAPVYRLKD